MRNSNLIHILKDFDEIFNTFNAKECCSTSYYEGLSISEDKEKLYIDAELPGVKPEEVEVTIEPKERKLLIKGKPKEDREDVHYHLKQKAKYCYQIPLSNEVDIESEIEAVSKDGILSITLSKNRGHKPLKVDVRVA
ncbi:MAG: Hsp20/alpha crystallin family protein [Simkaniaceae bacterium]|nr:Hsp20/alpha crystallin family protein [Candidatus Sacchlamyda saccharinae]